MGCGAWSMSAYRFQVIGRRSNCIGRQAPTLDGHGSVSASKVKGMLGIGRNGLLFMEPSSLSRQSVEEQRSF
ncbi:Hypothetical protein NTJ_03625 [Nesidiocoris tenuis]|uniref:Uncharacterized protein n=1 Tax=Nesidiocoris tenuis TaxID=355587 RepID=A0ABN7AKC2_9HEMI|nr:Hypothetical protein NTJ_03625 [Nesidiocoris tenuis]